jgi:hypothetical protein
MLRPDSDAGYGLFQSDPLHAASSAIAMNAASAARKTAESIVQSLADLAARASTTDAHAWQRWL